MPIEDDSAGAGNARAASANADLCYVEAKETGQVKTVNGFNSSEILMTVEMKAPQQATQMGIMEMEIDSWISADGPGVRELRDSDGCNAGKFPWTAVSGGGGNPSLQQAMAAVQKKFAEMNGVALEQTIKVKTPGMGDGPSAAQTQGAIAQARAKLEAMNAQGGPMAVIAEKQLARMGPASATDGGSSSSLIEMTMDAGDFSSATAPESVFLLPDGYRKVD